MFLCPEESSYYAAIVEMVLTARYTGGRIIELGTGTGGPILKVLNVNAGWSVLGTERDEASCRECQRRIVAAGLGDRYHVLHGDFFELLPSVPDVRWIIANPPYLPAREPGGLIFPGLWGGPNGNELIIRLLRLGIENIVLLVPSFSDPGAVLNAAREAGYALVSSYSYLIAKADYSNQAEVAARIRDLKDAGKAFDMGEKYILFGWHFSMRSRNCDLDAMRSLIERQSRWSGEEHPEVKGISSP